MKHTKPDRHPGGFPPKTCGTRKPEHKEKPKSKPVESGANEQ